MAGKASNKASRMASVIRNATTPKKLSRIGTTPLSAITTMYLAAAVVPVGSPRHQVRRLVGDVHPLMHLMRGNVPVEGRDTMC